MTMLGFLLLVTYWPPLSLWLPHLLRHQHAAIGAQQGEDHRIAQAVFLRATFGVDRDRQVAPALGQHFQHGETGLGVLRGQGGAGGGQAAIEQLGQLAVGRRRLHLHRRRVRRQGELVAQVEAAGAQPQGQDEGEDEGMRGSDHGDSLGQQAKGGNRDARRATAKRCAARLPRLPERP